MHIWVDADACPNAIKAIVYRAANRSKIHTTLVANHPLHTPPCAHIHFVQVTAGFDVADEYIATRVSTDDIVITGDIPLAAIVVGKGAQAINPRGMLYTPHNVKQALAMRNFMEEMRNTGQIKTQQPALDSRDKQAFANTLDKLLAKKKRASK